MRKILFAAVSLFIGVGSALAQPATPKPPATPSVGPVANPDENSVYGASNVRDFLAACRADQGGCIDEVGTALMDKMDYSGSSNVCVSSVDYGKAVPGWLSAHPQTSGMPTEDGIYLAIKTLYPCATKAQG